jgi:hypothetical protein
MRRRASSSSLLLRLHPITSSDSKPEPSKSHAIAALDVEVDKKWYFPELLLAVVTVYQTIATARLQSVLTMGWRPQVRPRVREFEQLVWPISTWLELSFSFTSS